MLASLAIKYILCAISYQGAPWRAFSTILYGWMMNWSRWNRVDFALDGMQARRCHVKCARECCKARCTPSAEPSQNLPGVPQFIEVCLEHISRICGWKVWMLGRDWIIWRHMSNAVENLFWDDMKSHVASGSEQCFGFTQDGSVSRRTK